MFNLSWGSFSRAAGLMSLIGLAACTVSDAAVQLPDPAVDISVAKPGTTETAVLAGGCFWGVQAVFQHVRGVKQVTSGYSGGSAETAKYEIVSSGTTGHAESVRIAFDPSLVTYGQILKVFFSVAHNPTELNRQGPDVGTQYRSVIFYGNAQQKRVAEAYITQLNAARIFRQPIVTQVVPLKAFYAAEAYHQDYLKHHPDSPYIVVNDLPKIAALHRQLPGLYVGN